MKKFLSISVLLIMISTSAFADCAFESSKTKISRVVAIDSLSGPVYPVTESTSQGDRLKNSALTLGEKEIAIVFAGGPQVPYTTYILQILDRHCIKATFFFTGQKAAGSQKLVQEVERRGHTIAANRYSESRNLAPATTETMKLDIEKSFMSIEAAVGKQIAPFYLLNNQQRPLADLSYLSSRNISVWSSDIIPSDPGGGGAASASKLANETLAKVSEKKKGLIQFNDARKATVDALDSILNNLKREGYRIVHLVPSSIYVPNKEILVQDKQNNPSVVLSSSRTRNLVNSARDRITSPSREAERVETRENRSQE